MLFPIEIMKAKSPVGPCRIHITIILTALAALAGWGCKKSDTDNNLQVGIASWYGKQFQGKLTASGEPFDMNKLTAAHRTFPLGTKLRVQSLANQQTVEVRINDRGPFVADRIIDLSHAAAQSISIEGIGKVRLEVLSLPPTRAADLFAVQIGTFQGRPEAEQLVQEMQKKYGAARLVFREQDQTWRVLVGLEPTPEGAESLAQKLPKDLGPIFVVRVDTEQ